MQRATSSEALRAEVIATKNKVLREMKCSDVVASGLNGGSVRCRRTVCKDHYGGGGGLEGCILETPLRNCFNVGWRKSRATTESCG